MLDIYALKDNGFKIKGKKTTILIDPPVKSEKCEVEIHTKNKMQSAIRTDDQLIIAGAGEYESSGVTITGILAASQLVYKLSIDEIDIAYLDDFKGDLEKDAIATLGNVDVLMIQHVAPNMIKQIEPAVLIIIGNNAEDSVKTSNVAAQAIEGKLSLTKEKLPEPTVQYYFK